MPAQALTGEFHAKALAVVATFRNGTSVRHVGLLIDSANLSPGCNASIYDMGPPLHVESPGGTAIAHAVGWVDGMTTSQYLGMEDWLQDKKTWLAKQPMLGSSPWEYYRDYTVHPAAVLLEDEHTKIQIHRFSCAGFVERCYAEGAQLVLVDHDALPCISFEELRGIWPEIAAFKDKRWAARLKLSPEEAQERAVQCGLEGDGPWPILLPGHLLHSLARADVSHPYRPGPTDSCFPGHPLPVG